MTSPTGAKWVGLGLLLAMTAMIGACRSLVTVPDASKPVSREEGPIDQRLFLVVHGDADYLYHDGRGHPHRADRETLREAFEAARSLPRAEVFIAHLRARDPFLGLFARNDGTLYHFRRGRLIDQTTYDQNRRAMLSREAQWIRNRRSATADTSLFRAALYYGHAVPERARRGYHRSTPEVAFGVSDLTQGLARLSTGDPVDVVVLSTCDGGTPQTVAALTQQARYVVAAPGDLHLSFIDADLLSTIESTDRPGRWARRLTDRAFQRLTDRTVTGVQLAVYDLERAGPSARRMADQVPPDTSTTPTGGRHVDCRRVLGRSVDTSGVYVRSRAPRFGPQANRDAHSGWGCLPSSNASP